MLAVLSVESYALMGPQEAAAAIQSALDEGRSADEIIEMLREDGRSLEEATQTAVATTSGESQIDLARAGICASRDIEEAEDVGAAALDVAPLGEPQDEIKGIIETYETTACQGLYERAVAPPVYSPTDTGGGGTDPLLPGSPSS